MQVINFLSKVKVKRFAVSVKRYGDSPIGWFRIQRNAHFRVVKTTTNKTPDVVFTVIGRSNLQEGYSDWIGPEEGWAWVQMKYCKVYIVANSLGRRFKVLLEDMEVLSDESTKAI